MSMDGRYRVLLQGFEVCAGLIQGRFRVCIDVYTWMLEGI